MRTLKLVRRRDDGLPVERPVPRPIPARVTRPRAPRPLALWSNVPPHVQQALETVMRRIARKA